MVKRKNQASGKGLLEIDWQEGLGTLTLVDKNGGETVWNFFELLEEFNGKNINFSLAEDIEVEPVEEA